MAVIDDVRRLAAEDIVHLTRQLWLPNQGTTEVLRGRLRQALDGSRLFDAALGQNGVVGVMFGIIDQRWSSQESPAGGLTVAIMATPPQAPATPAHESVTLSTNVPTQFVT